MKLTKKVEAEVLKVYHAYWKGYMSGDMKTFADFLDNDVKVIGSTESEVFFNKKEALSFYQPTADQITGNAELRNRIIKAQSVGDLILITEQNDFYILIENNWTFYAKGRLSTLFQEKDKGWKIIQQHGSMPDIRATEGEQFALVKISKENIELRDAVKRRTIELESTNRELEIEAALERVRAVAMGMMKPDDMLSVCKTISHELTQLGVKEIRNVQTAIFYESRGTYMNYEYYAKHDKTFITDVDFKSHNIQLAFAKKMMKGPNEKVFEQLKGKKLQDWYIYQKSTNQFADKYLLKAHSLNYYWYSLGPVALGISTYYPLTKEETDLFKRFLKVFELAYRRYLDIEKAIGQAREAEIQLALERVRARSLAMHYTSELQEIVHVVAQQLQQIGVNSNGGVFITINKEVDQDLQLWASSGMADYMEKVFIPVINRPIFIELRESIKKGNSFFDKVYSKEEKDEMFRHLFQFAPWNKLPPERKKELLLREGGLTRTAAISQNTSIVITNHNGQQFSAEEKDILKRFGYVFEQAYTRFLDLQNAEAQTREAQINLAVERVRAKALAMHKSDEIHEVVYTLRHELFGLNLEGIMGSTICLQQPNGLIRLWDITDVETTGRYSWDFLFDINQIDSCLWVKRIWNSQEHIVAAEQDSKDIKRTLKWVAQYDQKMADDITVLLESNQITHVWHRAVKLIGGILIADFANEAPAEIDPILLKIGAAFDLAYTRFLDLQKAEAQAREARIEAALEKVRSRSLAMHKSEELKEVVNTVYERIKELNLDIDSISIIVNTADEQNIDYWIANENASYPSKLTVPVNSNDRDDNRISIDFFTNRKTHTHFSKTYSLEEKNIYFLDLFENSEFTKISEERKQFLLTIHAYALSIAYTKNAALVFAKYEAKLYSKEENIVLQRFAKVFEQTYTRFLDLQKAEAQTREAQIEGALERVRSRSVGMQKSEELKEVIQIVFDQFVHLNIKIDHTGFVVEYKPKGNWHFWIADQQEIPNYAIVPYFDSVWGNSFSEAKEKGIDFFTTLLNFEEKNKFYRDLLSLMPGLPEQAMQFYFSSPALAISTALSENVALYIENFSGIPYLDEENAVLMRFCRVFQQTYTRFLDLQKAEAQTRAAKIEGALERVRARALAMQQPEELKEVAEVLRHEMGLLGVEELETCSIYINDVQAEKAECWYALKDIHSKEKKLVNDYFTLDLNDTWVGREMLRFYKSPQNQTSVLMQGANRKEWINYCEEKSIPFRGYYGEVIPDRTYHLYKFSHGAIGAAAAGDISIESWDLLKRAASVFSLAYSRFKDLTQARTDLIQLKVEKKKAEDALTELQAAQKQLIQSEKMASLGELTAGIAHEIQNPLNFVNNFSEVSREMIDELKPFDKLRVTAEQEEVLNDIDANLEKINHHGKRAADIVKGMLQHSRSSSGVKEPTDINALCDEYLRLSYHGFRAKDKSFNAQYKTDFDESIGTIKIIPQDIGRVVMNLLTNAFYSVREKSPIWNLQSENQKKEDEYEPTVSISTKKIDNKIEIRVNDNGNGIPSKLLDKIFQPFFTTKPTGQGTGLGLSLSYDIVKAHGGELKVETQENAGTTFIISLPLI